MTHWEYARLEWQPNNWTLQTKSGRENINEELGAYLNRMGAAGWEMVAAAAVPKSEGEKAYWEYVFKRPIS